MTRAHSLFGASSAKRLLTCPPSYYLGQKFSKGSNSSKFAAEGTLAHSVAEKFLQDGTTVGSQIGDRHTIDGHEIVVDEDMEDFLRTYTDYVETLVALGYEVFLECRVSPDWLWLPKAPPVELFGTADCIAYHAGDKRLVIADLKYGRGVPVDAFWNPQLLYYALGAFRELGSLLGGEDRVDVTEIDTVIIQPRAPHPDGPVRKFTYTPGQITDWGRNVLKPGVELAVAGTEKTLTPGDHCRFCPALAHCPELKKTAADVARKRFEAEDLDDDLSELLKRADIVELWVDAVRKHAHETMEQGVPVPGFKLVNKRATRAWVNAEGALLALKDAGLDEDDVTTKALMSPAKILKMKPVKANRELSANLNDLIEANSSGTTVVSVDDPRPAVEARRTARDAFANEDVNED